MESSLTYGVVGLAEGKTSAGVNYPGIAFLVPGEFKDSGATVFAFRACYRYRKDKQERFQIWRPAGGNTYRLIAEVFHRSELEQSNLPDMETVRSFNP